MNSPDLAGQTANNYYGSGMPEPDDFATLRQVGFEVVINLALPTSDNALPNEIGN